MPDILNQYKKFMASNFRIKNNYYFNLLPKEIESSRKKMTERFANSQLVASYLIKRDDDIILFI